MARHHHPNIPGQGHGEPVDDGLDHRRGGEAIGHARGIGAKHTAARAAGDEEALLIHPTLSKHRIHHAHEVFVVRARIGLVDFLGEGLAIARRASGVRPDRNVAFRGVALNFRRKGRGVHGKGAAVDFQKQRRRAVGAHPRRDGHPGLDGQAVEAGGHGEFLNARQGNLLEQIGVEVRHNAGRPRTHLNGQLRRAQGIGHGPGHDPLGPGAAHRVVPRAVGTPKAGAAHIPK